ncbi:outer membrane autotransporter protein [Sporomusaceae bacterium BoRhaA]|uniref:TonB-dependent receptor domain-containing protein n=1 Tax=Pelorhabdus rhamnosifermentans TaxID=2772457 RepID=UPI001C05EDEC|nr:TonB-dependent receptor [Pelorhabdus rhamnosifermentans]MBU2700324.1 outer membrane autotransporter protein [Pelorhabdus rhamnosifermentans]
MNHIYKVIWNRARGCWQVVSELAKNKGKQKSSRRQRLGGCAMRRLLSRTAALTALTIGLTCLPVGLMSVARADDGTTTASGLLSYDANNNYNGGVTAKTLFSDWASGNVREDGTGGLFNTIELSSFDTMLRDPTKTYDPIAFTGWAEMDGSSQVATLIQDINTAHSKSYNALLAVIQVPDPSNPGQTITKVYNMTSQTWSGLVDSINPDYWENTTIAKAIAQAIKNNDQAALKMLISNGLPKFYVANGTDWQDGVEIGIYEDTAYPNLDGYFSLYSVMVTVGSTPSTSSSYSFSYPTVTVPAGGVWRPLDRLLTTNSSIFQGSEGTYSISKYWDTYGGTLSNPLTDTVQIINSTTSTIVTGPTIITVNNLMVGKGGTIDLSYLNTHYDINGNYNPLDPAVSHDCMTANGQTSLYGQVDYEGNYPTGIYYTDNGQTYEYYRSLNRDLLVQNASLADGTTLRLGVYGSAESAITNKVGQIATIGSNSVDAVYIKNATTPDSHANLYITLGWVPGLGHSTQGEAAYSTQNGYPLLLGIESGASNFTVTGKSSVADGIFSQYEITPVIGELDNYFTNSSGSAITGSTAWYLQSYSYLDLGTASESGRSAADNNLIMNNLWRNDYLNMFRRVGSLHRLGLIPQPAAVPDKAAAAAGGSANTNPSSNPASWKASLSAAPAPVEDQKENIWAETWHGQYHSADGYGRTVGQNYNGLEVGYDKLLNHDIADGKVYAGIYASNVEGDSNTATGGGTQKSQGLGIYETWVGNKGHYLDVALLTSHLKDNYHLTGNTGSGVGQINGDYSTWGYGLGVQYGYHDALKNNWYWEPSASLYAGRINGLSYSLSNNLGIQQNNASTLTGRLGMQIGKQLDSGQGSVHAGVALLHEFENGTAMHEFFGDQTRTLDTMGGKDTWWEFNVGGNYRISPTGVFNLDVSKTDGSRVGSGWQINGGLNWTWGGFWSPSKASSTATPKATKNETVKPEKNVTVIVGRPGDKMSEAKVATDAVKQPTKSKQETAVAKGQTAAKEQTAPKAVQNETPSSPVASTTDKEPVAATAAQGGTVPAENAPTMVQPAEVANTATNTAENGEYSFAPVTVEAERPDWEKALSPGQVTVIYPEKFEGEQKDLPDLLERVPGLFVQRVDGIGHYTVARVRGSTAAEVAVYVDGVLINLNSEAAVNLSAIPVDNVERIEVYRGYVPVQFSGAPMGGVINIITKKPKEVGGSVSQGFKSYGGYNATYQLTAPIGDGSLLATFQRDIWGGNFPFRMLTNGGTDLGEFTRRSNGYQNDDGMVKWQDDHWDIKASWKQLHEQLPRSVTAFLAGSGTGSVGYSNWYEKGYYDAQQDIDEKDFQIGRRNTAGNLDWGWKVSYIDSRKSYRDTGLINGIAAGAMSYGGWAPNPGQFWAEYHSKKWDGNLNGAWKLGDSHLLEFNADVSQEKMHANGSDWSSAMFSSNYSSNNPYSSDVMLSDYHIKEYHLTLQDTMTLNEAGDFKFTPIVRADKVDIESLGGQDRQWKYSGAAALQKQLNNHWSVKTTWGTYNRHPNFYELFGDGADIQPNAGAGKFFGLNGDSTWETGKQFDFSLNWQGKLAKADTETVLTWFDRHSQNQLVLWTPLAPHAPSTYLPMDSTQVHGLELTHTMTWNRLTMSLAATWQESEMKSLDTNYLPYTRSMTYMPEWVYNVRFDYRFPGDKLNVFTEYHYTDRQYIGWSSQDKYDEYIDALGTVNVGMKYAFNPKWELSTGVNDLFNRGYDGRLLAAYDGSVGGTLPYPFAGRMYYMTMKYKF